MQDFLKNLMIYRRIQKVKKDRLTVSNMRQERIDTDRDFINKNFLDYGSAWAGGLEAIEKHYDVKLKSKKNKIIINFLLRAPPAVNYTLKVERKSGRMMTEGPNLPDYPELSAAELENLHEKLQNHGELWLSEPLNGDVSIIDLSEGLEALQEDKNLQTRLIRGRSVLYLQKTNGWRDLFCLWLGPGSGIEGGLYVDVPMSAKGRLLQTEEINFIDRAMQKNGNFGVYGNVQSGFRSLVTHMHVCLSDDKTAWHVKASPHDGHGHFLNFSIEKGSGEINGCMAGHVIQEPLI